MSDYRQKTKAIRAGQTRTSEREHNDPIFTTSSFVFDSAEHAAQLFAESESGNIYSRFTNPTVRAFEQRLAALENSDYCIATSSGMSAILSLCLATLHQGDHIVASRGLFGSTISLFTNVLSRFGVGVSYFHPSEVDSGLPVRDNTRLIFIETPSNPICEIVDIAKLSEIASMLDNCIFAVDNCACTPILQKPINLGADVVVHSATKFLDGQGRAVGGAILTNDRALAESIFSFLRTAGPSMSPFNAWIFHKGLETLPIRMQESCLSAMRIAEWLESNPRVDNVYYPGLENHNGHKLAKRQQTKFGALLSFEVTGGQQVAWKLIDLLKVFSITANLGDAKSTVTHPSSTTHRRIQLAQREQMGIKDGLIRLSIGLEDVNDLIEDLEFGLENL